MRRSSAPQTRRFHTASIARCVESGGQNRVASVRG
jgi:hypothetical protein